MTPQEKTILTLFVFAICLLLSAFGNICQAIQNSDLNRLNFTLTEVDRRKDSINNILAGQNKEYREIINKFK